MEIRKVVRAGGSLVIALPKTYTRLLKIHSGSYVEIRLYEQDSLILTTLNPAAVSKADVGGEDAADERI